MNPSTSLGTRSKVGMAKPSPPIRQAGNIWHLLVIRGVCRRSLRSACAHVKYRCRCRAKEQNQEARADAAEATPTTPPAHPCPHPVDDRSHFGDIAVCRHCWVMLEDSEATTAQASETEEGQVHSATRAA